MPFLYCIGPSGGEPMAHVPEVARETILPCLTNLPRNNIDSAQTALVQDFNFLQCIDCKPLSKHSTGYHEFFTQYIEWKLKVAQYIAMSIHCTRFMHANRTLWEKYLYKIIVHRNQHIV